MSCQTTKDLEYLRKLDFTPPQNAAPPINPRKPHRTPPTDTSPPIRRADQRPTCPNSPNTTRTPATKESKGKITKFCVFRGFEQNIFFASIYFCGRYSFFFNWLSSPKIVWKRWPKYWNQNTYAVTAMLGRVRHVSLLTPITFDVTLFPIIVITSLVISHLC